MKNSGIEWIGQIPDSWKLVNIGNVLKEYKNENKLLDTHALQFKYGTIVPKKETNATQDVLDILSKYNVVKPNIIMVNGLNLAFDFVTQRVALVKENGVITSTYIALSPQNLVVPQYATYVLKSYDFQKVFHSLGRGLRCMLSYDILRREKMPLPSLDEQKSIVDCLEQKLAEVDKLIEVQQAQIEKLKEYKQSVITEAVTKGLNPTAPMKDSGVEWIGKISVESRIEKLKFLLSCPMQYGANESGSKEVGDGIRYVRITDITEENALKNSEDNMYLPQSLAENYILRDKDVLFARSGGTVGKTFIYEEKYGKCAFAGYLIKAECDKKKLLARFLSYYTQSSIYELWKNSIFIQATIQNIGATKYSNMEMVVHSIEEQKNIVSYLDDKCAKIDKLIALKQSKIEKLQEYKKSLIYEYVTGKKEVM